MWGLRITFAMTVTNLQPDPASFCCLWQGCKFPKPVHQIHHHISRMSLASLQPTSFIAVHLSTPVAPIYDPSTKSTNVVAQSCDSSLTTAPV